MIEILNNFKDKDMTFWTINGVCFTGSLVGVEETESDILLQIKSSDKPIVYFNYSKVISFIEGFKEKNFNY